MVGAEIRRKLPWIRFNCWRARDQEPPVPNSMPRRTGSKSQAQSRRRQLTLGW